MRTGDKAKELGRIAYEEYCKRMHFSGAKLVSQMPTWENLTQAEKDAWLDAALAAIRADRYDE